MVVAKVRGQFARWSGSIVTVDGEPATASVEAVIDASSIETGVADRDAHLKSADFLDVANHPELTFKSTRTEALGEGRLRLIGDLTIRGTRREVALDVEYAGTTKDPWGNERAGITAKASIDRKDFGLAWNQVLEAGGLLVGDRVDIEIEVEAVKQAETKVA
jgi:polyisoprenoid-binding protein YceI